ncbi:Transcriptional regulator PadR-like family protein [compost metagenome]
MNRNKPINNNSLYPKLKQFQAEGIVRKTVIEQSGRPDRYLYSITEAGEQVFNNLLADLSPELVTSDEDFYLRLAFFDLLEPIKQSSILQYREIFLHTQIEQLNKIMSTIGSSIRRPYSALLSQYTLRQMECELELLDELLSEISN